MCCNGILAGLVSITAPCAVVEPGFAILIGILGGSLYFACSNLMLKLKIDDPLDAASVHGFCGVWGVLSAGIFAKDEFVTEAYGETLGNLAWGTRLGNQIIGCLAIFIWTICPSAMLFKGCDLFVGLRTEEGGRKGGLDVVDFGMPAYAGTPLTSPPRNSKTVANAEGPVDSEEEEQLDPSKA